MSGATNIKTIQSLYAAFGKGDVPTILEALANDVKWGIHSNSRASKSVPWHEYLVGKTNVPKFFATLASAADFTKFEPHAFVADEQYVYCSVAWEATLKKNGSKLAMTGVHRFTFDKGRITEWFGTEDTALAAEALGVK
jgi:uncharacterized protein